MTRRSWTAEDQIIAEVAAACGVSFAWIGKAIGRSMSVIQRHMSPGGMAAARKYNNCYYKTNLEIERLRSRDYYHAHSSERCKYSRAYQKANRNAINKRMREWCRANPDKIRTYAKRNYAKNYARIKRYNCQYYVLNKEKLQERNREYHINNREANIERCRTWANANRAHVRETNRRRKAFRRAARVAALCPLSQKQLDARYALWRNRCAFCGVDAKHHRNAGHDRLSVEHVLALTKNGLDEADNIMPACHSCNSSKSNTPVEIWYRRQPFFTESRWRKIQRHCPAAVAGQLPLAFSLPNAEPAP